MLGRQIMMQRKCLELEELNAIQGLSGIRRGKVPHFSTFNLGHGMDGWEQGDTAKFGGSRILRNSGVLSASLARRERDDKSNHAT